MANLFKILTALAVSALLAASPVMAQDSGTATDAETPEAPAAEAPATGADPASPTTEGLSMGEAVTDPNAPGTPYDKAEHGAWTIRCIRAQEGKDPCELYQLLIGPNDVAAAEISMFALPEGRRRCGHRRAAGNPADPTGDSDRRWRAAETLSLFVVFARWLLCPRRFHSRGYRGLQGGIQGRPEHRAASGPGSEGRAGDLAIGLHRRI